MLPSGNQNSGACPRIRPLTAEDYIPFAAFVVDLGLGLDAFRTSQSAASPSVHPFHIVARQPPVKAGQKGLSPRGRFGLLDKL